MYGTTTATSSAPYQLDIEAIFLYFYQLLTGARIEAASLDWTWYLLFFWTILTILSYLLCFALLALLVYLSVRQHQIEEAEADKFDFLSQDEAEDTMEHSRWSHIQTLIEGTSESEWRQAIIEADIMLDDVLKSYGYPGDTVAEKLKFGDPARFRTLQDAWDAHKVRNEIAHEGSAYQLNEQIAHRTIARFRNVFEEFNVI